jgi:hypothetical protein
LSVVFANGVFVIVGGAGSQGVFGYSTNGTSFTWITTPAIINQLRNVIY